MIILIVIATFIITLAICFLMEWLVHGKFMHAKWPTKYFQDLADHYFQNTHKEHHRDYPPHSYKNSDHGPDVKLPLWTGAIIVCAVSAPAFVVSYFTGLWSIIWTTILTSAFYFWAYNYVHTCLHVPNDRWFETTKLYNILDKHHIYHHIINVKWGKLLNICILCPFMDSLMGTKYKEQNANPSSKP